MIDYRFEVFIGNDILDFSNSLPSELVAVFTESDRLISNDETEDDDMMPPHTYEATVRTIRDRLEIMGYTSDQWRQELEDFKADKIEREREFIERRREFYDSHSEVEREKLAGNHFFLVAERSSSERWVQTLLDMIGYQWGGFDRIRSKVLNKLMLDEDSVSIDIPFSDNLSLFRAAVDVHPDSDLVRFEFGNDLFRFDPDVEIQYTVIARSNLLEPAQALQRILILTEGKSDSKLLRSSLQRLFPHLEHMYSFLDHSSFRAPGGTGDLERLARGFAGAGVSNRVIVLFDNDTAGVAAAKRLREAKLPLNFYVLSLPDIEIARSYPTLGPTGMTHTDINGRACGIELYCGKSALTAEDGELCPIQWTGYDRAMERYQGEPLEKEKIKERFFERLKNSPDPESDPEFSSICLILKMIMGVFWYSAIHAERQRGEGK
ncbi:MAG: toprim domain-containing protein [Terracidiphilus sp.]